MKEIQAKTLISKTNTINIYKGCTHGCIYCDSRSECYGLTYDFEDVRVKTNAPVLLKKELGKKEPCVINFGSMSDPYLPLEQKLSLTRRCLKTIYEEGFGVSLITKSDLVLRDMDILKKISKRAKAVVNITITTANDELCKILEPNVSPTSKRFEALKELQANGLATIVWLTPTLPYINDTRENLLEILERCKQTKIKALLTFGFGMTLRRGNREYYYKELDKHFPELKKKYIHKYALSYGLKSPNSKELTKIAKDFCKKENIIYGMQNVFDYINEFKKPKDQITFDL